MKRVVVAVSPFAEPHEFLGVDGEVYSVVPNAVLILPELNAKVLEKHRLARIVGEYQEPEEDPFERWQRESIDPLEFLESDDSSDDPVRAWAQAELQKEYSKPSPDLNRIVELRMIAKGLNPAAILSNDTAKPSPSPQTQSHHGSPTGLCSPIYNTVQTHYSESDIKSGYEINADKLRTAFETFGLRLTTTLQAYRVAGLNELDLSGYAILDYGYTRVEPHREFVKLLRHFGYEDKDVFAKVLFEQYHCERHGAIFKPALDFEKIIEREGDEYRKRLKVYAGRLHPMKKHSDAKRYSALKLEQFNAIAEAVREKGVISYRKFDDVLSEVKQEKRDLALIWMVFTVPEKISEWFMKEDVKKATEAMKKAARSTLKRFLRKYLKKHENVPLTGEFKEGGMINVHIWSSSQPVKPHFHVHVGLWNFVVWNGKYVRFTPYIPESWVKELRELWKKEILKWIRKLDFSHYLDEEICRLFDEDYEFFNIYTQYNWFREENYGKIVHHLRYNARKAVIDINEFFYSGTKFEDLSDEQKEWLGFLVQYSNRTGNFGFMNRWRQVFNVSRKRVEELLNRLKREHYEYCPICKNKLEYVGIVTIDEIAKWHRLLVLWWFDRKMNIEVWRGL